MLFRSIRVHRMFTTISMNIGHHQQIPNYCLACDNVLLEGKNIRCQPQETTSWTTLRLLISDRSLFSNNFFKIIFQSFQMPDLTSLTLSMERKMRNFRMELEQQIVRKLASTMLKLPSSPLLRKLVISDVFGILLTEVSFSFPVLRELSIHDCSEISNSLFCKHDFSALEKLSLTFVDDITGVGWAQMRSLKSLTIHCCDFVNDSMFEECLFPVVQEVSLHLLPMITGRHW